MCRIMSDLDRLLAAADAGELVLPNENVPNLVDLSRAVAMLSDAEGVRLTPGAEAIAKLIGACDHIVFVLADGLGMDLIERTGEYEFLNAHLEAELTTVFPSATAVALTTLATCEWPSQHAVTGSWTYLPEIESTATVIDFVTRKDGRPLHARNMGIEQVFPIPSAMDRIGRDSLALYPKRLVDSVYSTYFSKTQAKVGYSSIHDAIDIVLKRVEQAEHPTHTYLYSPRIDRVGHIYGTWRPEIETAIQELDRELARLTAGLNGNGRVIVSADHGLLDAIEPTRHRVRPSDGLVAALRHPPSGDTRVMYFHVRDGCEDVIRDYFHRRFGERFVVLTIDEAEEISLFGPGKLAAHTKARLGDMMALSIGQDVIEYRATRGGSRMMSEASHHSGLTPAEMRIPLIIA